MPVTHTLNVSYNDQGGLVGGLASAQTGNLAVTIDSQLSAGAVNQEYDETVVLTAALSIWMSADQSVTVKTNSSSAPQDTINIPAGGAVFWNPSLPTAAKPFTGSVTKFFVTNNNASVVANFKARFLSQQ